jgi:hypothetical protein
MEARIEPRSDGSAVYCGLHLGKASCDARSGPLVRKFRQRARRPLPPIDPLKIAIDGKMACFASYAASTLDVPPRGSFLSWDGLPVRQEPTYLPLAS